MPEYVDSWLRFYREEAELSQDELANDAGISKVFLNKVERGRKRPSRATTEALAEVLAAALEMELKVEDVFPRNGMKTPRQAAWYYRDLLKAQEADRPGSRKRRKAKR